MLYELLLSPTYRWPWKVKEVYSFKWGAEFPRYPRCGTTMEREYQCFCDRCGQRLNWSGFNECEMKYMEWDGMGQKMTRTTLTSTVSKWMTPIKKIPPR
nr:MAG TPA: zinc-ribbon containing domain protein [Caudoviricetes sp.]